MIGKHTLAIMCIHQLDFYWINWGNYFNSWVVAAIARLIVDLAILCIWLIIFTWIKAYKLGKENDREE